MVRFSAKGDEREGGLQDRPLSIPQVRLNYPLYTRYIAARYLRVYACHKGERFGQVAERDRVPSGPTSRS